MNFLKINKGRIGKTYEEIYGIERAKKLREQKRLQGLYNNPFKGKHHSIKTKIRISNLAKKRLLQPFSGRKHNLNSIKKMSESKKENYNLGLSKSLFVKGNTYWNNPNAIFTRWGEGNKHPNWKGGTSREPYPIEWRNRIKKNIRNRDKQICQICEKPQSREPLKLAIHHIDYNKYNLSQDNLITLCKSCHTKTNNQRRDYWNWQLKVYQNIFNNTNNEISWRKR